MSELINFTALTNEQKLMVLSWRNDERISAFMKNKTVGKDEHFNFIESLKSRNDRLYFLVKNEEKYIGVIDFIKICDKSCEFGIYGNPNLKGVGKILMQNIIDYARKILKIGELNACVYKQNERAIKLYKKFNFEIKYQKDQMIYLSKNLTQTCYNLENSQKLMENSDENCKF